jgi:hypothetical protein
MRQYYSGAYVLGGGDPAPKIRDERFTFVYKGRRLEGCGLGVYGFAAGIKTGRCEHDTTHASSTKRWAICGLAGRLLPPQLPETYYGSHSVQ